MNLRIVSQWGNIRQDFSCAINFLFARLDAGLNKYIYLWKQFELQVIPRINPAFTYMCYHQLTFCTEVIWVFCAENSKDFFCKLFACSAIMSSSERSPLTCNESWKWIHLANVHNYISQLESTLRLVNLALKLKSSPTIWTQRY